MTLETGSRRGFLIGALALMTAPAIVRADSLMKIVPIDLYDTRCLIDYHIGLDTMVVRVDRLAFAGSNLGGLARGERVRRAGAFEIPMHVAKELMPKEAHFAFSMTPPEGVQRHVDMALSSEQVRNLGLRGYVSGRRCARAAGEARNPQVLE